MRILIEKDKQQLLAIIARTIHTPIEVWAYGSRVNRDAHDTSDLDLVLRTAHLNPLDNKAWQTFDWATKPKSFHDNILRQYEVLKDLSPQ